MNIKGFTLIELLAVMVILSIITLIAIPIVLDIIEDGKKNVTLRSAENYINAVEYSVAKLMKNQNVESNIYNILLNGNICLKYEEEECINELEITVKNQAPNDGTISIKDGIINKVRLVYGQEIIENDENNILRYAKTCTLSKDVDNSNSITTSDEIECSGEFFYVINNDGSKILMLSKYNLDIGNIYDESSGTGVLNKISNPTGIQNSNARAYVYGANAYYGTIEFSSTRYWHLNGVKTEYGTSYPVYVYDSNSELYQYIEGYKAKLEAMGIKIEEARLISKEELDDLKNKKGNPKWLYQTTYWSGTAAGADVVWYVGTDGFIKDNIYFASKKNNGVRPLIEVSVIGV